MQGFSVVVEVADNYDSALDDLLYALVAQQIVLDRLQIILVSDSNSEYRPIEIGEKWRTCYPEIIHFAKCIPNGCSDFRNAGLHSCTKDWIIFSNLSNPFPPHYFECIDCFLKDHLEHSLVMVCTNHALYKHPSVVPLGHLVDIPMQAELCLFRNEVLFKSGVKFNSKLNPGFVDADMISRYLLTQEHGKIGLVPVNWRDKTRPNSSSPGTSFWSSESTYKDAIEHSYLGLLTDALNTKGIIPQWLQRAVLNDLHWYFRIDMDERAPTSWVQDEIATNFHHLVKKVMSYIDSESLNGLDFGPFGVEILHALSSYMERDYNTLVYLSAYDHAQSMVRFNYYLHGTTPTEWIFLDGETVKAEHCKYRSCKFFRRTLFYERIVWIHVHKSHLIQIVLDGKLAPTCIGRQMLAPVGEEAPTATPLSSIREALAPGQEGRKLLPSGLPGLKARMLRFLAKSPFVQKYFRDAWVFADRENEADDNAEHLYRWVRQNHPEIKTWFLLSRSSPDWSRLSREGFRLMPRTWLRKILLLNCKHIISSQPIHFHGGFSTAIYGDLMTWKFTYLKHGVIEKDMSHWLNKTSFDRLITASPDEHKSIVDDDTPYIFTTKETRRTGLCRHDMLGHLRLRLPVEEVDALLVMPSWRGKLAERVAAQANLNDQITQFANSGYAKHWRSLLGSEYFHKLAAANDKRIVFMPHPNCLPFLSAFDPPSYVDIKTKARDNIQDIFCRTSVMITDYSSVAFEMAYLQRPVIYYQFDRERFFGADHNWREGYFNYERDGFGPVATNEAEVFHFLNVILSKNCEPDTKYLERMNKTFPERDGKACKRVYKSIIELYPVVDPFISN